MFTTILTKSGGVLGPIASLLGWIMNVIYESFQLIGIQNIALSIIIFTFITKALMLPLTIKQQKFSKLSSRMNPELQKIQAKYKGKKDQDSLRKQQTETQAIYQKYGASPTSGCLPLLISLPIMFALFQVINNIPAYVNGIQDMYEAVAMEVKNVEGYVGTLTTLAENLRVNIGGFEEISADNIISTNHIIDILAKFGTEHWDKFANEFPMVQASMGDTISHIKNVNTFLGFNITNSPGWAFPGIIIPFLAMALQFVQSKQLQVKNKDNSDNPASSAMSSMNVVMPIMSGVFTVALPIGVGLYWIASSIFAIVQQFFVNKYMDHIDIDELIEKSSSKAKGKRKYATNSSSSLQEIAKKQTKAIDTNVNINSVEKENDVEESTSKPSNQAGSISDIANILKNRDQEKGDK